ncbi:hypothetical protein LPU83_pLPU83c_0543 (plasmid) [Rhizobium favelukesii]|uniref:Uncharacterized protein n=2 Tax=Rhizobium/Agrobacterium group TaxID=227290 RepID=W6RLI0_9HYPH|nr:hypothetical protein LPU83_pLPU83c_0543 [Rhizobium favelukesii]
MDHTRAGIMRKKASYLVFKAPTKLLTFDDRIEARELSLPKLIPLLESLTVEHKHVMHSVGLA